MPYLCRMKQRFELKLSSDQRRELDALAHETGLSAGAITRLAIKSLLANPGPLLGPARTDAGERQSA